VHTQLHACEAGMSGDAPVARDAPEFIGACKDFTVSV
jgi:hypothetical protein